MAGDAQFRHLGESLTCVVTVVALKLERLQVLISLSWDRTTGKSPVARGETLRFLSLDADRKLPIADTKSLCVSWP